MTKPQQNVVTEPRTMAEETLAMLARLAKTEVDFKFFPSEAENYAHADACVREHATLRAEVEQARPAVRFVAAIDSGEMYRVVSNGGAVSLWSRGEKVFGAPTALEAFKLATADTTEGRCGFCAGTIDHHATGCDAAHPPEAAPRGELRDALSHAVTLLDEAEDELGKGDGGHEILGAELGMLRIRLYSLLAAPSAPHRDSLTPVVSSAARGLCDRCGKGGAR